MLISSNNDVKDTEGTIVVVEDDMLNDEFWYTHYYQPETPPPPLNNNNTTVTNTSTQHQNQQNVNVVHDNMEQLLYQSTNEKRFSTSNTINNGSHKHEQEKERIEGVEEEEDDDDDDEGLVEKDIIISSRSVLSTSTTATMPVSWNGSFDANDNDSSRSEILVETVLSSSSSSSSSSSCSVPDFDDVDDCSSHRQHSSESDTADSIDSHNAIDSWTSPTIQNQLQQEQYQQEQEQEEIREQNDHKQQQQQQQYGEGRLSSFLDTDSSSSSSVDDKENIAMHHSYLSESYHNDSEDELADKAVHGFRSIRVNYDSDDNDIVDFDINFDNTAAVLENEIQTQQCTLAVVSKTQQNEEHADATSFVGIYSSDAVVASSDCEIVMSTSTTTINNNTANNNFNKDNGRYQQQANEAITTTIPPSSFPYVSDHHLMTKTRQQSNDGTELTCSIDNLDLMENKIYVETNNDFPSQSETNISINQVGTTCPIETSNDEGQKHVHAVNESLLSLKSSALSQCVAATQLLKSASITGLQTEVNSFSRSTPMKKNTGPVTPDQGVLFSLEATAPKDDEDNGTDADKTQTPSRPIDFCLRDSLDTQTCSITIDAGSPKSDKNSDTVSKVQDRTDVLDTYHPLLETTIVAQSALAIQSNDNLGSGEQEICTLITVDDTFVSSLNRTVSVGSGDSDDTEMEIDWVKQSQLLHAWQRKRKAVIGKLSKPNYIQYDQTEVEHTSFVPCIVGYFHSFNDSTDGCTDDNWTSTSHCHSTCSAYENYIIASERQRKVWFDDDVEQTKKSVKEKYAPILEKILLKTKTVLSYVESMKIALHDYNNAIDSIVNDWYVNPKDGQILTAEERSIKKVIHQRRYGQVMDNNRIASSSSILSNYLQPIVESLRNMQHALDAQYQKMDALVWYSQMLLEYTQSYIDTVLLPSVNTIPDQILELYQQQKYEKEIDASYQHVLLLCHNHKSEKECIRDGTTMDLAEKRATTTIHDEYNNPNSALKSTEHAWIAEISYRNACRMGKWGWEYHRRCVEQSVYGPINEFVMAQTIRLHDIAIQYLSLQRCILSSCSTALHQPAISSLYCKFYDEKTNNTLMKSVVDDAIQIIMKSKQTNDTDDEMNRKDQLRQQRTIPNTNKLAMQQRMISFKKKSMSSYIYLDTNDTCHYSTSLEQNIRSKIESEPVTAEVVSSKNDSIECVSIKPMTTLLSQQSSKSVLPELVAFDFGSSGLVYKQHIFFVHCPSQGKRNNDDESNDGGTSAYSTDDDNQSDTAEYDTDSRHWKVALGVITGDSILHIFPTSLDVDDGTVHLPDVQMNVINSGSVYPYISMKLSDWEYHVVVSSTTTTTTTTTTLNTIRTPDVIIVDPIADWEVCLQHKSNASSVKKTKDTITVPNKLGNTTNTLKRSIVVTSASSSSSSSSPDHTPTTNTNGTVSGQTRRCRSKMIRQVNVRFLMQPDMQNFIETLTLSDQ